MAKLRKQKKKPRLPYQTAPSVVFEGDTVNTMRYEDVYYEHHVGPVTEIKQEGSQTFDITGENEVRLRIEVWTDDIIRFRYRYGSGEADFSYARDPRVQPTGATLELIEQKQQYSLQTATLRVEIKKEDASIRVISRESKTVLHEYAAPFYCRFTLLRGLDQMRLQFVTDQREAFYGLGDKAWDTNLQGRYFENWNSDSFAYGRERDALYRTIPFCFGLRDSQAYGVFLDNSYRSHFDFNSRKDGLVTIWADGGDFDYYFINGPELDEVARRYAYLTGRPELPPLWALGYHQCRWSYYPEERVRELAATFREKKIPCDALYLDIDYMDGYRCFTWDKRHFPDPKAMIDDLRADGFHTVVMIDPGIKVDEDYFVYQEGVERDAFCRRSTGEQMVGPVWPPECVWPDYTNPAVREWWGTLYRQLYVEQGVSGFWNDMNEPAVFKVNSLTFPEDVRHDYDGLTGDHKKAHNIYGMQMTRATYDGLKQLQPAKRPFLLGRASFSGGQRFAALWTGDNVASWEHLAIANRQSIRLAISGYSFVGSDIGGFVDDPSPELLTRWLQLAVFHPFMRIHSMGNNEDGAAEVEASEVKKKEQEDRQDQEPWIHGGEHTDRNRQAIELRYRLLPYLYTVFRRHVKDGTPALRNLFFYDQTDPQCRKFGDQFLFGDNLLICPVVKPGLKTQQCYLPRGIWYDYWSGRWLKGKKKLRVNLKPDRLPIYVRAGAVVPTIDPVQSTSELEKVDTLRLTVFLADEGRSEWYWDAGEGYGYQMNQFTERTYRFTYHKYRLQLSQEVEGSYNANFQWIDLQLVGLGRAPSKVMVDGQELPHSLKFNRRAASVRVPFAFTELIIE